MLMFWEKKPQNKQAKKWNEKIPAARSTLEIYSLTLLCPHLFIIMA